MLKYNEVINILLPTDFSPISKNALSYAMSMFGNPNTVFTLMHAFQVPYSSEGSVVYSHDALKNEAMQEMEALRDSLLQDAQGAEINLEVTMGSLPNILSRSLKSMTVDMIIMGTKGATGLKEMFFGSNTAEVIRTIPAPTLAIPEGAVFREPKKILLAIDYEDLDLAVLDPLLGIAKANQSNILVLNIILESQDPDPGKGEVEAKLRNYLRNFPVTFHTIRNSNVTEDIEQFSAEEGVDMVTTLPRHKGFLNSLFHKSISKKLALHAKIPLLAIPTTG